MRIASFNASNLNAADADFVGRPDSAPWSAKAYATQVACLAARLTEADADIVGFQEIFAETALREVVAASSMADALVIAPDAVVETPAFGRPVGQGPYVGLASRYPITAWQSLPDFPEQMQALIPTGLHGVTGEVHQIAIRQFERPVLRAEIDVPGLPGLTVFVAHLKSKGAKFMVGEDSDNPVVQALGSLRSLVVRAVEAAALRALIVQARNEWVGGRRRPVILLGDVNDDLGSVTTEILVGRRPFPNRGAQISRYDYHHRTRDLMLSAFELVDLDPATAYSHVFDGKGAILDMVLLSADFWGRGGEARARVAGGRIINAHLAVPSPAFVVPEPEPLVPPGTPGTPKDWLKDPEPSDRRKTPKPGMDHGVPVVEITLP
jgi:endonuclease/exonuclease/phosphatase family metal-dependent hydrolase